MHASILSIVLFIGGGGQAEQHFTEAEARLKKCTSLSGALAGYGATNYRAEFRLLKPGYVRKVDGLIDIYSDGKVQTNHIVGEKTFFRRELRKDDRSEEISCLDGFYGHPTGSGAPYFVKSTSYRMQQVDGRMLAAKVMVFESYGRDDRMVFYVDPQTKLPVGWDQVFGGTKMHYRLRDLKLNPRLTPADFVWKQPAGLTDRTRDAWEGRYAEISHHKFVQFELRKAGDQYVLSSSRGDSTTEQRMEGTFDPKTLRVTGVIKYEPGGTSTVAGQWVADKQYFELTVDQDDSKVTHRCKRLRRR